ncbi:MAG: SDR family oxidoreductase [Pseudonocardiaceae bacterium]|nr:SDR family oxidoreductase [Pseudonocardiaceae bacterium]
MPDSLKGKAVVITGAGRGIGKEIALLAAAEGAEVVVNDLGGGPDGAGADQGPAQEVVDEIRATGGSAVVDGHSVAEPESAAAIVETAVSEFGRIDAVINNAGILRDRIFHRMSREEWDDVVDVHLNGYFHVSRAAAGHFREQGSGAFVHLTSTSGLVGNFGQANYASAKLGIVGLSKSIALDMARYNVRSNCIAPFAWSRLVATIPTGDDAEAERVERLKTMTADKIAPLAVLLASDLSLGTSGQIFGIRKNEVFLFSQPRPVRSIHRSEGWTPQTLAEQVLPAFRPAFYPLDRSGDVFSWDPI